MVNNDMILYAWLRREAYMFKGWELIASQSVTQEWTAKLEVCCKSVRACVRQSYAIMLYVQRHLKLLYNTNMKETLIGQYKCITHNNNKLNDMSIKRWFQL